MPLSNLDTDQMDASTSPGSEVVISAGAGSGKTHLLVGRYLYLVKTRRVPMSSIVAITFTEKAANQMKAAIARRARKLSAACEKDRAFWESVATGIHTAPISTIHAFCNSILRSYPLEAGLDPLFTILDDTTLANLMREALDSFIITHLDSNPETMDILIRRFGMSGLKHMFRTLLGERTRLVTFLDTIDIESPETLEHLYIQNLKKQLEHYVAMLREFHTLAPGEDSLYEILGLFVERLSQVLEMCEKNEVDVGMIHDSIEWLKKVNAPRKGSKNKWEEKGVALEDVKGGIKDCVSFLEVLSSFFLNERGVTAPAATLLLDEYKHLERHFLELKKLRSCIDHDDTLIETWRLLRNNVRVCQEVSRSYKHILVDEFQDTDGLQMDILRMIAGNTAASLFTVGDPKQSIYRFRGADVTIFNEFIARHHVDFKTLKKNYRSTPALISFVNHTFSRIMGMDDPEYLFEARYTEMKPHRKNNGGTPGVEVVVFENDKADERRIQEADFIARRVWKLKDKYGCSFSDMALILRKGTMTRAYEEAFLAHNIPFVNLTSGDPFRSPEAYDMTNLLGWLCEPNNPVFFSALLMSPFFDVAPEVIYGIRELAGMVEEMPEVFLYDDDLLEHPWVEDVGLGRIRRILVELLSLRDRATIRELLEYAFDQTDYTLTLLADPVKGELSLSIVDSILESADEFELNGGDMKDFARLLSQGALVSQKTPCVETADEALTILTIHKAKGMEYSVVFLADITSSPRRDVRPLIFDKDLGIGFSLRNACGKTTRTLVSSIAADREKRMEIAESKRLFYVGCTRAENHLVISGGKPPREPDHMFEKSNWMGWLHTAMDISPDGDLSGECPKDLFEYMRISREDVPFSLSPAEYWRKVLDRAETAIPVKTPRLEKLIAPVSPLPISGKPEHLSPTQIMDYHTCPALYLFRHVYGFTGTHPGEHDGGFGERYGLFAHRVLEKWDFGAGLQVTGRGGSRTDSTPIEEQTAENGWQTTDSGIHELLSLVDTTAGSDIPRKWRDKLKEELRCFSNSPLYRHIRRADELHREEPFAFLQDDVLVRGTMDLFYKTGDDLYIVDYKTESIGADKVDAISERFRLQIGMYGVAVSRTEYQVPAKLVIYYLTPCASYEIPCSQKFLDDISSALTHIIDAMTGSDFSPKKSDRCETCPYAELCNR